VILHGPVVWKYGHPWRALGLNLLDRQRQRGAQSLAPGWLWAILFAVKPLFHSFVSPTHDKKQYGTGRKLHAARLFRHTALTCVCFNVIPEPTVEHVSSILLTASSNRYHGTGKPNPETRSNHITESYHSVERQGERGKTCPFA
jgi:hypothetical protein